MILATMAVVVFVSTSLGALQRFEKPHSHASSTCSAPEVKQPHADTNRVALVIGNFTLKADITQYSRHVSKVPQHEIAAR
jgi:hypothetical protein